MSIEAQPHLLYLIPAQKLLCVLKITATCLNCYSSILQCFNCSHDPRYSHRDGPASILYTMTTILFSSSARNCPIKCVCPLINIETWVEIVCIKISIKSFSSQGQWKTFLRTLVKLCVVDTKCFSLPLHSALLELLCFLHLCPFKAQQDHVWIKFDNGSPHLYSYVIGGVCGFWVGLRCIHCSANTKSSTYPKYYVIQVCLFKFSYNC